jgi:YVTN family beta-propeller protein
MRFGVLGPLDISIEGRSIALGGPKQRAVLSVLLLNANQVVSRDRLIDAVWNDDPPASAAESLDAYVYRLRKVVGRDRISRRAGGYLLRVDVGESDVERFNDLFARAQQAAEADDDADAVRLVTDALALWRGPAYTDLLDGPFGSCSAQLEEQRLSAIEARAEAQLRIGQGPELVAELEQLVLANPLRERVVAALMLALYRAGRQVEALSAYQAHRRRLVEDLGLEPGPALVELEGRMLRQDPTLLPSAQPTRPPRTGTRRWARRRRRGVTAAAIGALAVAALLFPPDITADKRSDFGGGELLALDARSGRVAMRTTVTDAVGAVAIGDGSLWLADANAGIVQRVDIRSGAIIDRIPIGGQPASIVSGAGSLWVASAVGATVTRIDPGIGGVTQTIALPGSNLVAVAFGLNELWVADAVTRELFEIDPTTGSLTNTVALDVQPSALIVADHAIWVTGYDAATVEKIDPSSGHTAARVAVGNGPSALAVASGAVWVANRLEGTISRIDLATKRVSDSIPVGGTPSALAAGPDGVWVADHDAETVARIDVHSAGVAKVVHGAPTALAVGARKVWVSLAATSHRGGTIVILRTSKFATTDPAFFDEAPNPQFVGLAYDGLITFQHSSGAAGLRLVPDLASAIPTATDGGTSYVFRLRQRIRYSNGSPLRAGDFRRAIERLFRLGSPGRQYFTGILGFARCAQQPAHCDLTRGIVTDDAAGTVAFHLSAPDSGFLYKLTEGGYSAPIPPGTPDVATRSPAPPGTGPYRIETADRTGVRFIRNVYFHEWSPAAQPDGNPDTIVWRYVRSAREGAAEVGAGRADWLFGGIPPAQLRELEQTRPEQLHTNPQFTVDFLHLNTRLPPFDDVRVRQALNYAIDRNAIAAMYGGPTFATPTCQPLAPGLPGYRRYCPYTSHPTATGTWHSPDLAKATALVDSSGTRGERIDVWGTSDSAFVPLGMPAYVAGVLRTLGYRAQVHLRPTASITMLQRRSTQLFVDGDWLADYPEPSSYLPQFFSCDGGHGNGYYCDPQLDRAMRAASGLELDDPARSRALWTSIDHQLTDNAGWVPTVNLRQIDYVSQRMHNYQFNPEWGLLLDQTWLG